MLAVSAWFGQLAVAELNFKGVPLANAIGPMDSPDEKYPMVDLKRPPLLRWLELKSEIHGSKLGKEDRERRGQPVNRSTGGKREEKRPQKEGNKRREEEADDGCVSDDDSTK